MLGFSNTPDDTCRFSSKCQNGFVEFKHMEFAILERSTKSENDLSGGALIEIN